jgi:hypothetical protein
VADLFADPFGAFVMSEFHAPDVEATVRAEEMRAVPGQVRCDHDHEDLAPCEDGCDVCEQGYTPPCPGCGAAV